MAGLAALNQVRHLYVGLDYPGHANVGALKAGTNGDIALLSQDGTAVAAGKKFMILKKNNKGTMLSSDVVDPSKILFAKSVPYVAPVLGSATISGITANANTLYTVEVVIKQFGSYSPENEYVKKAFYKAKVGDTAEHIVDGLVKSLARNFKREEPTLSTTFAYTDAGAVTTQEPENAYFTFAKVGTGAAASLTITEKTTWVDNSFDPDTKTRENIDFVVNANFETLPTIVNVASKTATGSGKQVAAMEFYLKGERNDIYRGAGYPHNFKGTYDAEINGEYHAIELGYFEEGRDEAKKSKKGITVYFEDADKVAMNVMIADLNTILGAGTVSLIA